MYGQKECSASELHELYLRLPYQIMDCDQTCFCWRNALYFRTSTSRVRPTFSLLSLPSRSFQPGCCLSRLPDQARITSWLIPLGSANAAARKYITVALEHYRTNLAYERPLSSAGSFFSPGCLFLICFDKFDESPDRCGQ